MHPHIPVLLTQHVPDAALTAQGGWTGGGGWHAGSAHRINALPHKLQQRRKLQQALGTAKSHKKRYAKEGGSSKSKQNGTQFQAAYPVGTLGNTPHPFMQHCQRCGFAADSKKLSLCF